MLRKVTHKTAKHVRKRKLLTGVMVCLLLSSASTTYAIAKDFTVGVAVAHEGATVGVVQDMTKVEQAKQMIDDQMLSEEGGATTLLAETESVLTIVKKDELMDEAQLAEALVQNHDALVEVAAISVDGTVYAVAEAPDQVAQMVNDMLTEEREDRQAETAQFSEEVAVLSGVALTEDTRAVSSTEGILEAVAIQTVSTETTLVETAYGRVATYSVEYPAGTEVVISAGVNGVVEREEEVTVQEGVELSRSIVAETTIAAPIAEEVIVGTGEFSLIEGVTELTLPLPNGYLSSPFGPRWGTNHDGVDLCVATGTVGEPVVAAWAGTVTAVEYSGGYGNLVEIDHGNGYNTLYTHLDDMTVAVGDVITAGTLVGHGGNTGNTTGAHLHFELQVNGEPIDPMPYLPEIPDGL